MNEHISIFYLFIFLFNAIILLWMEYLMETQFLSFRATGSAWGQASQLFLPGILQLDMKSNKCRSTAFTSSPVHLLLLFQAVKKRHSLSLKMALLMCKMRNRIQNIPVHHAHFKKCSRSLFSQDRLSKLRAQATSYCG